MLGKQDVLDLLAPITARIPSWFLESMSEYNATLSDKQKIQQGPIQRALWVQRGVLAHMQADPAVVGPFRPFESNQREGLLVEADPFNVCVLFNKARRDHRSRLQTCRNPHSGKTDERLEGYLTFNGIASVPVMAYWTLREPENPLNPEIEVVGIGEEARAEFEWAQPLWTRAEGLVVGVSSEIQPRLPGLPEPNVRLRRQTLSINPTRIGAVHEETASGVQSEEAVKHTADGTT